jgi:MFS family permease
MAPWSLPCHTPACQLAYPVPVNALQGIAMGGEFGSAIVYISELADGRRRGTFVALLQMTVNIGMMLATALVMLLENTVSPGALCQGANCTAWCRHVLVPWPFLL